MFKPISYDIKEVIKLFSQKRTLELRGLSNRLIREASIENNLSKAELGSLCFTQNGIKKPFCCKFKMA